MAAISAGEFERIFKEFYKPLCLFALRFTEKTEDARGRRAAGFCRCLG